MAKNRKKRGLIEEAADSVKKTVTKAAHATVKAAEKYVVEPVRAVLGPTPPRTKVKKARYQRPPRQAAKSKVSVEDAVAKTQTRAAKTLTHGVAKSIPKAGAKTPEKKGPGPK